MEAKHTATPWEAKRVEQAGNGEWLWCVYDEAGMVVAKRLSQAKAERIVRACNAHDDLVAALAPFAALLQAHREHLADSLIISEINGTVVTNGDLKRARAALAKAGAA